MSRSTIATGKKLEELKKVTDLIADDLASSFHKRLSSIDYCISPETLTEDFFMQQIDGVLNGLVHFAAYGIAHMHQAVLKAHSHGVHNQDYDKQLIDGIADHIKETFYDNMRIYRDLNRH